MPLHAMACINPLRAPWRAGVWLKLACGRTISVVHTFQHAVVETVRAECQEHIRLCVLDAKREGRHQFQADGQLVG